MHVELGSPGLHVEPDHVYILPSGKEMTVADGHFLLQPRSKLGGWTNVFTLFLDSLADSRHPGIAVVLSGLDHNGSAALKAFRENGGITIVQSPESAEHPQMPQAAIKTGSVNYVLVPEAIAKQLEAIAEDFKNSSSSRP